MFVIPDLIEQQALAAIDDHHAFALAALERDRGLAARTIPKLETVDLLAGAGFRLREDKPPACLLGVFGTADRPKHEKNGLTVDWTLAAQITVVGAGRKDVIRRRNWYAVTVAQTLLWFLPRLAEPIDTLALTDLDFTNGSAEIQAQQRTVGEAQLIFAVRTRAALATRPPYDPTLPPGQPGGPPTDPYEPPVDWPQASSVTSSVEKEPIQ